MVDGKFHERATPPLNSSRRCVVGWMTSHQAIYFLSTMLLLSTYWFSEINNILGDAHFLVAKMDPNPLNELFPSFSIPIDIVLRRHRNAECSQRIER